MTTPTDRIHPDTVGGPGEDLPDALRFQLHALRRDELPSRELWPAIAARLTPPAAASPPPRRWIAPLALAATLVIAVGGVGLWRDGFAPTPPSSEAAAVSIVQREAAGMASQYDAALSELALAQGAPPSVLQPALDELDRSLSLIHDALSHDPDSRLLLDQLRRTYAHRLALAQRAAYS